MPKKSVLARTSPWVLDYLMVPQPVPGKLFWSVTVYDAETRSQVQTDQGKAALRSLFELKDKREASVDLYFVVK
jgi:hypothetical protein